MWAATNTPGKIRVAICVLLAALVWAVFGQTGWFQFVNYDDFSYVVQNPHVAGGLSWQNAGWAFTHVHSENWHPLTTLSHMLDGSLFGLRPGPQHLVNVLLHSAGAVLLFLALEKMNGDPSRTGNIWPSAFVAAVFAIHPLRVESVAWISERKDVLSGVFFMLTLLAYASYARRRTIGRYALTALFFAAGLMSKPTLVMTPFVLLLLDYWPLERFRMADRGLRIEGPLRGVFLEKVPFLLLSLGSAFMTIRAQGFAIGSTGQLPIRWRLSNAVFSYFEYVRQTFWPHDLVPFYIHPEGRLGFWTLALSALTIALITAAVWIWRRPRKYLLVGWLWYLILLIPVLGLMQVGLQAKADRYTYLPQIGLLIAIAWLARDLLASWEKKREIVFSAAAAILLSVLSVLSFRQTSRWRDTETLWTYTLGITPDSDVAHVGLAGFLYDNGQLDDAIRHYRVALSHRPENGPAQNGLAKALADQHKTAEAMEHWKKAVEIEPDNTEASNAVALNYVQVGDWAAGIKQWENTLRFEPNNFDACNNLSWALSTVNDAGLRNPGRALELARRATQVAQNKSPAVYRTLAVAYGDNGRFDEGIQAAEQGLDLCQQVGNEFVAVDLRRCIDGFQKGRTWREILR